MLRYHILYGNVTAGNRRSAHKGARLDLVRNNGILRAVKLSYTLDTDGIRTGALDIGSHTV